MIKNLVHSSYETPSFCQLVLSYILQSCRYNIFGGNTLDIFKARNILNYFTITFLCDLQTFHLMIALLDKTEFQTAIFLSTR